MTSAAAWAYLISVSCEGLYIIVFPYTHKHIRDRSTGTKNGAEDVTEAIGGEDPKTHFPRWHEAAGLSVKFP